MIQYLFFGSISGNVVWCCLSVLLFAVVCRYCCLVLCVGTVVLVLCPVPLFDVSALLFGVLCRYCLALCVGTVVWCCVSALLFDDVSALLFGIMCSYRCLMCVGTVVWRCVCVGTVVWCRSLHMTFLVVCGGLKTFQFGVIFSIVTLTVIRYARTSNSFRLQYLTPIFTAWRRFFAALP